MKAILVLLFFFVLANCQVRPNIPETFYAQVTVRYDAPAYHLTGDGTFASQI